jgi:hypothetical protein
MARLNRSRLASSGAAFALVTLLCFYSHVLLEVQSADVLPGSLILAYTVDKDCPLGWDDMSFDADYGGRMIKGWNQVLDVGMTVGDASKDNSIITHVHSSWSNHLVLNDYLAPLSSSTNDPLGPPILDYNGNLDITQANSMMDAKPTGVQSRSP